MKFALPNKKIFINLVSGLNVWLGVILMVFSAFVYLPYATSYGDPIAVSGYMGIGIGAIFCIAGIRNALRPD